MSSDRNTLQDDKVDFYMYISLENINMNFQSEQESLGILLSLQNSHVCVLSVMFSMFLTRQR